MQACGSGLRIDAGASLIPADDVTVQAHGEMC